MLKVKRTTNSNWIFLIAFNIVVLALPLPTISIVSQETPVAGEIFTVTCMSSVIPDLVETAVVSTSWTDNEGNTVQSDVTLMSDSITSVALQFNPLYTSSVGQYFCTSSISIPELSVQQRNSQPFNITVQSK